MKGACFIEAHVDYTEFSNRRNERWPELLANFNHSRDSDQQDLREKVFVKVTRLQDEFSNVMSDNARVFDASITDVLVAGQQNPAVLPHRW